MQHETLVGMWHSLFCRNFSVLFFCVCVCAVPFPLSFLRVFFVSGHFPFSRRIDTVGLFHLRVPWAPLELPFSKTDYLTYKQCWCPYLNQANGQPSPILTKLVWLPRLVKRSRSTRCINTFCSRINLPFYMFVAFIVLKLCPRVNFFSFFFCPNLHRPTKLTFLVCWTVATNSVVIPLFAGT